MHKPSSLGAAILAVLSVFGFQGCSQTEDGAGATASFAATPVAPVDAGQAQDASLPHVDAATPQPTRGPGFAVPEDSKVCDVDLPFKPPGCPCDIGDTTACWTGPADQRGMGQCKDGVQTCVGGQEFATWGACEGQVLDCGEPPPDPPEEECLCVPGAIVGCDEDCEALVFCAPSSTKVCQPDGTFGPCREALLPTPDTNLLGCINVFHGCFAENDQGVYVGDCSKAFTCGHPPSSQTPN
jgi:hypothetical protein